MTAAECWVPIFRDTSDTPEPVVHYPSHGAALGAIKAAGPAAILGMLAGKLAGCDDPECERYAGKVTATGPDVPTPAEIERFARDVEHLQGYEGLTPRVPDPHDRAALAAFEAVAGWVLGWGDRPVLPEVDRVHEDPPEDWRATEEDDR